MGMDPVTPTSLVFDLTPSKSIISNINTGLKSGMLSIKNMMLMVQGGFPSCLSSLSES